jgi:hypothetical protein
LRRFLDDRDDDGRGNLLTSNFGGTVPPTVTGGVTDGDVNFAFAPIADGDNVTTTTFAIMITAVTDVPATASPADDAAEQRTFSGGGISPTTPPPVTVTVTAPLADHEGRR